MENWFFLKETKNSAAYNMACDEFLLDLNHPVLRLYSWDCVTYSIGYIQKFENLTSQIPFIRRMTGGGLVEHNSLTYTYSIALPSEHFIAKLERLESYYFIHKIISKILQKPFSFYEKNIPKFVNRKFMKCFKEATRYDIIVDGEKIAGSAQRRTKKGLLHQGILKLSSPQNKKKLDKLFYNYFSKIIPCTFKKFFWDSTSQKKINYLIKKKYSKKDWNFSN